MITTTAWNLGPGDILPGGRILDIRRDANDRTVRVLVAGAHGQYVRTWPAPQPVDVLQRAEHASPRRPRLGDFFRGTRRVHPARWQS